MMQLAATLRRERRLTGRQVLVATLAFFGLVIAANLAFVFLALDTFSGTVSDRAYQEGLAYNERLAGAAEQRSRGWTGALALIPDGLSLTLGDRDGRPVAGLTLVASLSRPATRAFDRSVALIEVVPGRYLAALDLEPGNWLVLVEGSDSAGSSFRTEARLWR
jgi:nitrogen fixation protein FixH